MGRGTGRGIGLGAWDYWNGLDWAWRWDEYVTERKKYFLGGFVIVLFWVLVCLVCRECSGFGTI